MTDGRMLKRDVLARDDFTDLPLGSQMLYVHANLNADDEGFIPSIKALARSYGFTASDVEALKASGLVIVFESGVAVITDWVVHNGNLRTDRKKPTRFAEEARLISVLPSGRYALNGSGTKADKSGQNREKSENADAREDKIREDKRIECSTRARERACATYSDSVLEKSSEENEEPETEPNRGGFFEGAVKTLEAGQIEPGLLAELMKQATEADEVIKNGAEEGATIPFHILTDAPEESKKATLDVLYDEYIKSDVVERQVDGLIFGRRALGDTTDYEAHRAAYLDLTRSYGAREVLKAVEIALEAGHGGEVPYIRGVLRRRAS